ncbi:hypothetical protein Patl1_21198 [Pistacia atlantica]|uniref:Uncharacterized protein n=1 Tax=Pistacia atlantica TaxID=434234 RepID=A0ACC1BP08_9ROSI|nr:hypothetical protein Patl1_21198 [Pistacia atlantica]
MVLRAPLQALTLQSTGSLREEQELFERCLENGKAYFLPTIFSANMLQIGRIAMLNSNQVTKSDVSEAIAELDRVKEVSDNFGKVG